MKTVCFGELMLRPLFGSPPLGWRWAFYLVVPPGILLGLLCCFMPDPPPGYIIRLTPERILGVGPWMEA